MNAEFGQMDRKSWHSSPEIDTCRYCGVLVSYEASGRKEQPPCGCPDEELDPFWAKVDQAWSEWKDGL